MPPKRRMLRHVKPKANIQTHARVRGCTRSIVTDAATDRRLGRSAGAVVSLRLQWDRSTPSSPRFTRSSPGRPESPIDPSRRARARDTTTTTMPTNPSPPLVHHRLPPAWRSHAATYVATSYCTHERDWREAKLLAEAVKVVNQRSAGLHGNGGRGCRRAVACRLLERWKRRRRRRRKEGGWAEIGFDPRSPSCQISLGDRTAMIALERRGGGTRMEIGAEPSLGALSRRGGG